MHPTGLLSRRGARDPDRRRGLLRRPQRERTPSGSGTTPPSCEMAAPQPLVHTGFAVHGEGRAVAVGQHPPPRVRPSRDAIAGSVVLPVHAAAGRVGRSRPGARTASGRPAHAAPAGTSPFLTWPQPLMGRRLREARGGSPAHHAKEETLFTIFFQMTRPWRILLFFFAQEGTDGGLESRLPASVPGRQPLELRRGAAPVRLVPRHQV